MKKSITNLFRKFKYQPDMNRNLSQLEQKIEVVTQEEALVVRGGDKEYKPIYDEPREHEWRKPTTLFDFN